MSNSYKYHLHICIDEVQSYVDGFQTRIAPAFECIEAEAERKADEEFERLNQTASSEYCDAADVAEKAQTLSENYYQSLAATRQGVTNLIGAGLYHILEQQFDYLAGLVFPHPKQNLKRPKYGKNLFVKAIKAQGFHAEKIAGWSKILELELIANAVKHGNGKSAKELFEKRPELFSCPPVTLLPKLHPRRSLKPIRGEGFYLPQADIFGYAESIKTFWSELAKQLEQADY